MATTLRAAPMRPAGTARTGALHVDKATVKRVVDGIIDKLPRVEGKPDVVDLEAIARAPKALQGMSRFWMGAQVIDTKGVKHRLYIDVLPNDTREQGHIKPRADGTGFIGLTLRDAWFKNRDIEVKYLRKGWLSVLAHELAHAADHALWEDRTSTHREDYKEYLNEPREVRAHLAQMIAELSTDEAREELAVSDDPEFPWAIQPLQWADRVSETWDRVRFKLTPANLKRFQRAIADTYAKVLAEKQAEKRAPIAASSTPRLLFHTTSLRALGLILESGRLRSKNDFISFSEAPFSGDISGNDVVLCFRVTNLLGQVEPVEYTRAWFDEHDEQAAYVAGEGWEAQYEAPAELLEPPEDLDPDEAEFWEPDEDELEADRREAQFESFAYKASEREWVTRKPGADVRFDPEDIVRVLCLDKRHMDAAAEVIAEHGLSIPVGMKAARLLRSAVQALDAAYELLAVVPKPIDFGDEAEIESAQEYVAKHLEQVGEAQHRRHMVEYVFRRKDRKAPTRRDSDALRKWNPYTTGVYVEKAGADGLRLTQLFESD